MTWFRNQLPGDAVHLQGAMALDRLADQVLPRWKELRP
jgi:hypothetical protein